MCQNQVKNFYKTAKGLIKTFEVASRLKGNLKKNLSDLNNFRNFLSSF
jgi:hypothetical protein